MIWFGFGFGFGFVVIVAPPWCLSLGIVRRNGYMFTLLCKAFVRQRWPG
jgi:hypothetical protein